MDGFVAVIIDLVRANDLGRGYSQNRSLLTLPGYFLPTKLWDLLSINEGRLVAGLECKSQVGPSFGNNFNNRTEEAIGAATICGPPTARACLENSPGHSWAAS